MFRKKDPQGSLFETSNLVPEAKARRLQASWAETFRARALPLIDEELFAPLYWDDNGRPNRPVQTVFAVHLLKEMFGLTDAEALEQLEFSLLWHHALELTPEEAHLPQVSRQRLDSTHVISNIAVLSRLGLFCETIRHFLSILMTEHPRLYGRVAARLRGRYLKEDGGAAGYQDTKGQRRLSVCARDAADAGGVDGAWARAGRDGRRHRLRLGRQRRSGRAPGHRVGQPGERPHDGSRGRGA